MPRKSNNHVVAKNNTFGVRIVGYVIIVALFWFGPLIWRLFVPNWYHATESAVSASADKTTLPLPVTNPAAISFHYDRLALSTPIIMEHNLDPFNIATWNTLRSDLRQGVVMTADSNDLSQATTFYILGHSSDYYPSFMAYIFAGLSQSQKGDTFDIDIKGRKYVFTVVDKKYLAPNDRQSFASIKTVVPGHERAILVTCWPIFTTQQRLVVIGDRSI